MTDKVKYTVTMEVETDAVGPAQAIRQALDWARDTESGPGVVTVRAANLSPLRAAVADGRVAQLFTGPVHTGVDPAGGPDSTVHATIRQGVSFRAVEDIADRMQKQARKEIRAAFPHAVRAKNVASSLYDYGSELLRLDPGDDEEDAKPAGVDPDKVRGLVKAWRELVRAMGMVNVAFDHIKEVETRAHVDRLQQCARELEELTDDR